MILLALANAPILIGQSVIPGFLLGIGKPRLTFIATGLGAVILFITAPLLALESGLAVTGLILALLVSNVSLAGIGLYLIHRNGLGATGWRSALATLAASAVALGVCLAIPDVGHPTAILVVKFVVITGIYLTLAPLFGAVDEADIGRLGESLGEVSFVRALASPFLRYEAFWIRLRARS